jgi:hypothetical protein
MDILDKTIRYEVERDKKLGAEKRVALLHRLGLLQGAVHRLEVCCQDQGLISSLHTALRVAFYMGANCPDETLRKDLASPASTGRTKKSAEWKIMAAQIAVRYFNKQASLEKHWKLSKMVNVVLPQLNKALSDKKLKPIGRRALSNYLNLLAGTMADNLIALLNMAQENLPPAQRKRY